VMPSKCLNKALITPTTCHILQNDSSPNQGARLTDSIENFTIPLHVHRFIFKMFLSCDFFNTCSQNWYRISFTSQYLSIHESSTCCTILLCLSLIVFIHSLCCLVFWACLTVDLPFTRLTCQLYIICPISIHCTNFVRATGFQNETQNYFVYSFQFYMILFLHLLCLCFVLSH
jgi:hypothetical protein